MLTAKQSALPLSALRLTAMGYSQCKGSDSPSLRKRPQGKQATNAKNSLDLWRQAYPNSAE